MRRQTNPQLLLHRRRSGSQIKLMESDYTQPVNIGSDRLVTIDELADILSHTVNY